MKTQFIQFVLSHPSHPGNIGAVARAIKTMGFDQLTLINPKRFPCAEATQRASGAADVLASASVVDSMDSALAGSHCIVGTSSRARSLRIPVVTPKELAKVIAQEVLMERKVSVVFGAENYGLSNDELIRCHYHVNIPANPDYCSLNLASAVQLIAYELRCELLDASPELDDETETESLAAYDDMNQFYQHLEKVLIAIGFLNPNNPRHLMARLKRLYNRARPSVTEVNILRGILALTEKYKDKRN